RASLLRLTVIAPSLPAAVVAAPEVLPVVDGHAVSWIVSIFTGVAILRASGLVVDVVVVAKVDAEVGEDGCVVHGSTEEVDRVAAGRSAWLGGQNAFDVGDRIQGGVAGSLFQRLQRPTLAMVAAPLADDWSQPVLPL